MARKKQEGPDSVGYKKPPVHTRFRPGQSGNPRGRPKKAPALPDIIARELKRRVQIVSNGKRHKVSMLEAIVKQHLTKAAGGDPKAVAILYKMLKEIQPGTGNKLSELVQEFRAVYDRHAASEPDQGNADREEVEIKDSMTPPTTGSSANQA